MPHGTGLPGAVVQRSLADWPVVLAAWLLLVCATTLLATGVVYGDAVASGGRSNNVGVHEDPNTGDTVLNTFVGGVPSEVIALTGTIQYDLWANVLSRLELRWDTAIAGHRPFGGSAVSLNNEGDAAVGGPTQKNSFLIAANIIYKF